MGTQGIGGRPRHHAVRLHPNRTQAMLGANRAALVSSSHVGQLANHSWPNIFPGGALPVDRRHIRKQLRRSTEAA